jgi:hypothetical protein
MDLHGSGSRSGPRSGSHWMRTGLVSRRLVHSSWLG